MAWWCWVLLVYLLIGLVILYFGLRRVGAGGVKPTTYAVVIFGWLPVAVAGAFSSWRSRK
jgi:hypothetical protein